MVRVLEADRRNLQEMVDLRVREIQIGDELSLVEDRRKKLKADLEELKGSLSECYDGSAVLAAAVDQCARSQMEVAALKAAEEAEITMDTADVVVVEDPPVVEPETKGRSAKSLSRRGKGRKGATSDKSSDADDEGEKSAGGASVEDNPVVDRVPAGDGVQAGDPAVAAKIAHEVSLRPASGRLSEEPEVVDVDDVPEGEEASYLSAVREGDVKVQEGGEEDILGASELILSIPDTVPPARIEENEPERVSEGAVVAGAGVVENGPAGGGEDMDALFAMSDGVSPLLTSGDSAVQDGDEPF